MGAGGGGGCNVPSLNFGSDGISWTDRKLKTWDLLMFPRPLLVMSTPLEKVFQCFSSFVFSGDTAQHFNSLSVLVLALETQDAKIA